MRGKRFPRALAIVLSICMLLAMIPTAAFASEDGYVSETHDVFKSTETTIAPGVTQKINYAYAKDGKQMVYYVATADVTRDDVVVQTSYLNQHENGVLGMEKLTNQMAYANNKYSNPDDSQFISEYYNAVAGVNASFYNMTTGQPLGITYVDGVSFGTSSYDNFFAILNDGKTAVIDYAKNLGNYVDENGNSTIWQAVAGSQWLVRDGVDVTASVTGSYNTDRHSRTCVGITADGKVVTMVLDGRQEPFSCGGSMHELAQIMLEQGCVAAINLDGGGSTTYAARQAGSDSVAVINRPSDGSERSISAGLIIASTAAPSDVFSTAVLTTENNYVTPGSTVNVTAVGVSPAGTSAEIPANATWQLADSSFGSIDNGVFTSNGTAGDVVVQMVYEGNVVGETTIHVVIPDSIAFSNQTITVPYGKTAQIELTAKYGLNEVTTKPEDFTLTLDNSEIGTLSGLTFTAADETEITTSTVTAALTADARITAEAQIVLGKGSDVIVDFEDGTDNGFKLSYSNYNYYLPNSNVSVVTAENGKVHSGNYALALNIDYSNSLESGYQMIALYQNKQDYNAPGAQRLGMWMYIPDEYVGLWGRWVIYPISSVDDSGEVTYASASITGQDYDGINGTTGVVYSFNESGWHYVSIDTSAYAGAALRSGYYCFQFYISDRDGASFDYYFKNQHNVNGDFTVYIDDITFDYSSVIDDREAPVFGNMTYATPAMSDAVVLNEGTTINSSTIDFAATVADNMDKSNYTGIDAASVKAYVDGNEVPATYINGKISIDNSVSFTAGTHTVKFSICDKQGNYGSLIRTFVVTADKVQPVKVVAHDPSADRIKIGSIQYIDVVATNIEDVQSVTTTLDLDNMSDWQLDHMIPAEGFDATYKLQKDENIATITIDRIGDNNQTGEVALVSIPVRAWFLENSNKRNPLSDKEWTLAQFYASKEFYPIAVDVQVDQGLVTYIGGTSDTFTGDGVFIWTEMWANYANMTATTEGTEYYNNWDGGHTHTAEALDEKVATCTEDGYSGRTFCEQCDSVVDWGTTIPATGHTYDFIDAVLKCTACGELFSGTYTDGKTYVDGIVIADGWNGESYYVNGEKLTGINKVTAPNSVEEFYFDFGEDGISKGKYTGIFLDGDVYRYAQVGSLSSGWKQIDDSWYYFNPSTNAAVTGKYIVTFYKNVEYIFDETGRLTSGVWSTTENGTIYCYGPTFYRNGWVEIEGNTYYFDKDGYRYEGYHFVEESNSKKPQWYDFGDNGALIGEIFDSGLFYVENETYYLNNGVSLSGLILAEDGYYYYFKSSTYNAVKDQVYTISHTNGLMPGGEYQFDVDGKMIIAAKDGIVEENGGLYYYQNGELAVGAGLIELNGAYYYVRSDGQLAVGTYYVYNNNDLMPRGNYDFDADGKMIIAVKDGIVEENGGLYYYRNGELAVGAGLIELNGAYYYVRSNGQLAVGTYYVYNNNDLMPRGNYDFDADGKMIIAVKDGIVEENGGLYYYRNGELAVGAGLIELNGAYYYVRSNGQLAVGTYYVYNNNELMPRGNYDFDADGKMIIAVKDGIVEENGGLYYYRNGELAVGAGLIELNGAYYYVRSNGQLAVGTYYVYNNNELMPRGNYDFDADGKMIIAVKDGIVEENGGLYYYRNGELAVGAGLIELNGAYYYVRSNGQLAVGTYYVYNNNELMPRGNYDFSADGMMIIE